MKNPQDLAGPHCADPSETFALDSVVSLHEAKANAEICARPLLDWLLGFPMNSITKCWIFCYEARNDYTNNSETVLLCNRYVCARAQLGNLLIPRKVFCAIGVYRKYLVEAPEAHKIIPAESSV